ncbi:putative translational regulatory protein ArgL [Leclercia adecarboxylata]|uniref:putative translational regulatory protein ArgL n=1 Tax=Leclercia adecarboxylata TaxID=83655 RepID=UPI0037098629
MVLDGVQRIRIAAVFQQFFNNQSRLFALFFQQFWVCHGSFLFKVRQILLFSHTDVFASTFVRKIYVTGLQVNIDTYKVNFNSISGLCHVRIKCLNCIKNTS